MTGLTVILLLVVLATAVVTGARRWSLPAPSLLVVAGSGCGADALGSRGAPAASRDQRAPALPPPLYAAAGKSPSATCAPCGGL